MSKLAIVTEEGDYLGVHIDENQFVLIENDDRWSLLSQPGVRYKGDIVTEVWVENPDGLEIIGEGFNHE